MPVSSSGQVVSSPLVPLVGWLFHSSRNWGGGMWMKAREGTLGRRVTSCITHATTSDPTQPLQRQSVGSLLSIMLSVGMAGAGSHWQGCPAGEHRMSQLCY